ncbi:Antitoxin component YwqK of the YwqJK toxin-antitoxin module [Zobellia uliginosa]|uniref:Antitoxin component YwqK of the YwqJK toxin-antitoxin module n=1 Tax=Zobellia uliginosa TaxID=143224 RepID=A0ABY1KML9_9FLAO|nr:toxin-antitoxin system YwqK family antitoxin [Zobellia uliginosa]SIS40038.1 Antitoxin component YwqK of the YwqJK toxin-antitoxin module [Zobellia uliginosa]
MKFDSKKSPKGILVLFLVMFVTTVSIAQKNGAKTIEYVRTAKFGKEIVYYGENNEVLNGTFKIAERSGAYSEANFIDGKPDGKWMAYDSSGRLEFYSTFVMGVGNGKGESYAQDGSVLNTYMYKNGENDGEWTYRNAKGVYKIENYKEGSKEGKWTSITRDSNGKVTSTTTEYYKANQPTGKWERKNGEGKTIWLKVYTGPKSYAETEYFENGKVRSLETYADGKRNGKQESYYANGFKKEESKYDQGLKVMEKKYHDNGKLAFSATYNANGPIGVREEYNKKGIKTRHTPYDDGRLQGVDITYNFNTGNKYVEKEYKDGIVDGIYKEYYPNGELATEGQYVKGQREGKWKYYKAGKVTREIQFKNDSQVSEKRFD